MQDIKLPKHSFAKNFLAQTRVNVPLNKDSKKDSKRDFIGAMLSPSAEFGGLYTFQNITPFSQKDIESLYDLDYTKLCKAIFKQLNILDSITSLDSEMLDYALLSYKNFRSKEIAPLVKIRENLYSLELYHGSTFAFKDMALQPFSRLLDSVAGRLGKRFLILSATSGDTGPATLSGFEGAKNVKAICIYPYGGTSEIQRLQMTTMSAENLRVFGINGDFDMAQSALKSMLKNQHFIESLRKKGYELSAANSVNIARIAFQIVYYFVIARELFKQKIMDFSVIVPSGNFGNALGCFFAKKLGLNITKICIASNPNDILSEFFNTGNYDIRNKKLIMSCSPAMDILKSSNIERLLFAYFGATRTKELMESLDENLYFKLDSAELSRLKELFVAHSFNDKECLSGIKTALDIDGYLLDPHTSNAYLFANLRENLAGGFNLAKDDGETKTQVIISTAHFAKFAKNVLKAIEDSNTSNGRCADINIESISEKDALDRIIKIINKKLHTNVKLESQILELFAKKEIHTRIYNIEELDKEILLWV